MSNLDELKDRITKEFDNLSFRKEPINLYEPIDYGLSSGGKRIRPLLVLLGCDFFGGNIEDAIDSAKAMEVFHNFTLLHDDIMDDAPLRRGKPTVYKKWNTNTAILSGDTMLIEAYKCVAKTNNSHLSDVLNEFNKVAIEVCEGQQYDIEFENRKNVPIDSYLNMIKLKTSVLVASSLKIGAIIAGANKEEQDLLYNYGLNIGIAFQLQDDYLDVFADQDKFGKKLGGDILANKKTYLYIKALEVADPNRKEELLYLFSGEGFDDAQKIKAVTTIFKDLEIDNITKELIDSYFDNGIGYLKSINSNNNKLDMLLQFSEQLMNREY